jgi:hypothetical protein
VVRAITLEVQFADQIQTPTITNDHSSTLSGIITDLNFADFSTGKRVRLVVRVQILPEVKVLKQRLGEGAPVERIVTNTFRRDGKRSESKWAGLAIGRNIDCSRWISGK